MENQQNTVMSVKDWLITLIITAIPLIGLIMLFVWGFGSDTNPSKANWAKATLLFYVIVIALGILFSVLFGVGLAALVGSSGDY